MYIAVTLLYYFYSFLFAEFTQALFSVVRIFLLLDTSGQTLYDIDFCILNMRYFYFFFCLFNIYFSNAASKPISIISERIYLHKFFSSLNVSPCLKTPSKTADGALLLAAFRIWLFFRQSGEVPLELIFILV